jgi:hypothetical protein
MYCVAKYFNLLRFATGQILILFLLNHPVQSQGIDTLNNLEGKLLKSYNAILIADPFHRDELANQFYDDFYSSLNAENSFEYPFDTLRNIGKIYSPDRKLRIYTWNIPVGLADNLYFGIVQYYSKNENKYRSVKLNEPIACGLEKLKKDWQKTLYFQIIETKHAGQKYYTLLGFDFYGPLSNRKSIDVIAIDDFDELYFCEKFFLYVGKLQDRMVFEFNEKAVMILRYDEEKKMIVYDHLAPSKPSLEGKFEFYGPDFTYDGFKFEKGIWVNYSNIDITN